MTAIEAAHEVVNTASMKCVRQRREDLAQYDVKKAFTGNNRNWFRLDLFSASAIVAIDQALCEEQRVKFRALSLPRMASMALKLARPHGGAE